MSPTIFSYGALQVRWYGLMYVVAFAVVYFLVMYRYRVEGIVINKKATQNWFSIAILAPFSDL